MGIYESYRQSVEVVEVDQWGVARLRLNDGHAIPAVAFGTFGLGVEVAQRMVEAALEAGYRHLDCARLYGNEAGVGRALGQALGGGAVSRDELFVSSKVWNDAQREGKVRESFMRTLDELGLDYLDQFLLHWPEPGVFRASWEVLQALRDEGLVRSIGVSNFNRAALEQLLADGDTVPDANQMEHHPADQQMDTIAACTERGILYEAWSPFGRGLSLGEAGLADLADKAGVTIPQLILAWNARNRIISLPRTDKPQHVLANLQAMQLEIDPAILDAIDALNRHEAVMADVTPEDFSELATSTSDY